MIRNSLKFLGVWTPEWHEDLTIGLSGRWQDQVYFDTAYGRINQDSYLLLGGYLSYQLNDSVRLSLNLDNMTDEKYLTSVKYEQAYVASPRLYSLSIDTNPGP